ncbi:MAG: hypothetical protein MZV70_52050 [Desulfobacterales bacterium]|nr:hypothetical protein [Desulfobacterales bacterium]
MISRERNQPRRPSRGERTSPILPQPRLSPGSASKSDPDKLKAHLAGEKRRTVIDALKKRLTEVEGGGVADLVAVLRTDLSDPQGKLFTDDVLSRCILKGVYRLARDLEISLSVRERRGGSGAGRRDYVNCCFCWARFMPARSCGPRPPMRFPFPAATSGWTRPSSPSIGPGSRKTSRPCTSSG